MTGHSHARDAMSESTEPLKTNTDVLPNAIAVSFKPSNLTYRDAINYEAESRFPCSGHPIARWLLGELLFLALIGGMCGYVVELFFPLDFPPGWGLAGFFFMLLLAWVVVSIWRVRKGYWQNRFMSTYTLELSQSGIGVRTSFSEWNMRWLRGQTITLTKNFGFIRK